MSIRGVSILNQVIFHVSSDTSATVPLSLMTQGVVFICKPNRYLLVLAALILGSSKAIKHASKTHKTKLMTFQTTNPHLTIPKLRKVNTLTEAINLFSGIQIHSITYVFRFDNKDYLQY